MDPLIIVEVVGRGGAVLDRVRVPAAVVMIGRGYDNDVIIDDPFVDPTAVQVTLADDGTFGVEDLGSVNGVRGPDGPVNGSTRVHPGDELRIGRTRVRLATRETPVPAAATDARDRTLALMTSDRGLMAGLGAASITWVAYSLSTTYSEITTAGLVGETIGILLLLALWAGTWALASRLASGRARFPGHMAVACWVMAVVIPLSSALDVLPFMWPGGIVGAMTGLAYSGLFVALLHLHLGVATRLSVRRRATVASAITAGLWVLGMGISEIDETPSAAVSPLLGSLWPVPERWIPAEPIADFVADLDALDGELEQLVEDD